MPDQRPIDDALLAKFLAGETDPGESARVQQWLASQDSTPPEPGQDDFAHFERIWQTAKPTDQLPINTDAAWKMVQRKMRADNVRAMLPDEPFSKSLPSYRDENRLARYRSLWRIAAMLTVVAGMGWLIYRLQFMGHDHPAASMVMLTTNDQKISKTLPDGTRILLNRHSTLSFPTAFDDDHRDVTLTGEAFFEVKPDAQRPFRIQARQTTVQVLGTSFTIQAYDDNVSVAVRTGKVRFAGKRTTVLLTRNQQATFDASSDTIRQALHMSPNIFAYKTGKLVFDNEPLRDVVQTLNRVYNADVRLGNEKLGACRLTTRFDNAPLTAVVAITAETLGLRVRQAGKQVILEGTGCQ